MAAIGREGGESRSAAAREARQLRASEREVPLSVSRDGAADTGRPALRTDSGRTSSPNSPDATR